MRPSCRWCKKEIGTSECIVVNGEEHYHTDCYEKAFTVVRNDSNATHQHTCPECGVSDSCIMVGCSIPRMRVHEVCKQKQYDRTHKTRAV